MAAPTTATVAATHPMAGIPTTAAQDPNPLSGRRIAFTTPPNYSSRLAHLLSLCAAVPLPLPTVAVEPTTSTLAALHPFLQTHALEPFSALAFTSRTGVSALALALRADSLPLSSSGPEFIVAALGRDAELLFENGFLSRLCENPARIRVLVPDIASPAGLVKSLGLGFGRKILCPVPSVVDLVEPPVIPDFITDLEVTGWIPTKVPAYETRWMGPKCTQELVELHGNLDALVLTSTAEVEGLIKSLEELGWDWDKVRRRWPEMVVAAHGPVTAKGAESFGVAVDVINERFGSFDGVLEALELRWSGSCGER